MEKELEFFEEWYLLKKYSFKILSIVTVLADEKRAYRGTLNDFCECMDIQKSQNNRDKLKLALEELAEGEYIRLIVDKNIYTVSLAAAAAKNPKILKIKKAWYMLIRKNGGKDRWANILKVFLKINDMSNDDIITYKELGKQLNMSVSTVQRCVETIASIDFEDFRVFPQAINKRKENGEYYGLGQKYVKMLIFK